MEKKSSPPREGSREAAHGPKQPERVLHHAVLCPFSRKVRLGLLEKGLTVRLQEEKLWRLSDGLYALSPEGGLPALKDAGVVLVKGYPILEHLEEQYTKVNLMGRAPEERAEVRRLIDWFDIKFYKDVTLALLHEKLFKRSMGHGGPDSNVLKKGRLLVHDHLEYVSWLFDRRNWLGGEFFSWADITAAAHLSCLDYLGDVPWDKHTAAKDWYVRIKSRPHFRPFLQESFPGTPPSAHYRLLDF